MLPFNDAKHPFLSLLLLSLLVMVPACGGGGGTPPGEETPPITPAGNTILPSEAPAISVTITPEKATVPANGSANFTATVNGSANPAVTWAIKEGPLGGSISAEGIYTASSTPSVYHLIASSQADPTKSAIAAVTVVPPTSVSIAPTEATLLPNESFAFEAAVIGTSDKGVLWTIDEGTAGGSITPDGIYTAPNSEGTFHIRATSQADPSQVVSATVTVNSAATVSVAVQPETVGLFFGESFDFEAKVTGNIDKGVVWSLQEGSAGSISQGGSYAAPHTEGTFHVVATSEADPTKKGIATVKVTAPQSNPAIERVSVGPGGIQANDFTLRLFINGDGRYVTFESYATNLVEGDTNGFIDLFVHDRQSRTTRRVSVDSGGRQGNNVSFGSKMNWDGRYILFESEASNLVAGDTNGFPDLFIHDQNTGQTDRISVDSAGQQGNSASEYAYINRDGRYVTFISHASNLVEGDTNGVADIFVRDRQTGETSRVSVGSNGAQADQHSFCPSISDDGRYVSFVSYAANLVPGDTNGVPDVFVHDRESRSTRRVSVASNGAQANLGSSDAKISGNGRFVAIASEASNLVAGDTNGVGDLFVHDLATQSTSRASVHSNGTQGNKKSFDARISADGRYVTFDSDAGNLVAGDTNGARDIFVHDRQQKTTTRLSISATGSEGNGLSEATRISGDGRYVAFRSEANNLVPGDTNRAADIFVASVR
jgi:hypothetical protein